MLRKTCIGMSVLGMLLTACQAGSTAVAVPTLTLIPTFAAPTVAVITLPVPSESPTLPVASPTLTSVPTEASAATPTQEAHANWVTYHDIVGGFTILVPPTWDHTDSGGYPAIFSARVPPGTTLGEKMMWINVVQGVTECSNPNAGGSEATAPPENVTAAGGIVFLKESGADAGAGQRYNSTSYSTLKGAMCITITFILHSSNPQMYPTPPPDYDAVAESQIFDEMLNTFRFDQ